MSSSQAQSIHNFTLNNGRPFPALGLGTWSWPDHNERGLLEQIVYDAVSIGYRHFDTAWVYGVEEQLGNALRKAIADGLVRREELVVVTKVWVTNLSKEGIPKSANESLKNLGLDYIDVLLVHWPFPMKDTGDGRHYPFKPGTTEFNFNEDVDLYSEVWPAMEKLVEAGITKSIGLSNFTAAQIEELMKRAKIKPAVNQVESTPLLPNEKILAACKKYGIVMTAYSPFGGSPLPATAPCREYTPDHLVGKVEHDQRKALFESPIVKKIAENHKKTPGQILLKFHVQRGVATIPKTVHKDRLIQNTQIFDFELTEGELQELNGMKTSQRMCFMPQALKSKYNPFADEIPKEWGSQS